MLKNLYYKKIHPLIKKIFYLLSAFVLRTLSHLFFWIRPKTLNVETIDKILLIKMERIGDLVLSTPAIRAIKERFNHAHINLITNPYTKEIVKNDPNLDEVLVYDPQSKNLIQKVRFIKNLRNKKFDLAIDLNTRDFLFTPVWLSLLSGAKLTLGLDNFGRGFLFNIKVKPYQKPKPLTEEILHILSPLNITTSDKRPRLFLSDPDKDYIENYFAKEGIKESDLLICIHPGGFYKTLRWTKDGYAKVIQGLIKRHRVKVFLVGTDKEEKLISEIMASISRDCLPINLAGRTTLGQSMALISKCHLFIGNSSGPLHIAIGFNIPTISFLGPSIPERWWPQGKDNIVFRRDLACSPCQSGYCYQKDFACMRKIRFKEVIDAADRQLKEKYLRLKI